MTTKTYYATRTGLTIPEFSPAGDPVGGRVLKQNEAFEVTPELIEYTRDRLGVSWLEFDAAEQTKRWGGVRFTERKPSAGAVIGADDDAHMFKSAFAKLEHARKISDPAERKAAVQTVWQEHSDVLRDLNADFR
ncbi:hypothetical protein [Microbacterium sp. CR_7]|uniref:hypothetical protein n=1 Tax=Microbacterium sp. CR_7 TaxID=3055792 RepID=UPI0035C01264